MLHLRTLKAQGFRCFDQVELCFGPSINLFHGFNGSGKTSLLEAISYLSLGRSFRSRQHRFVVQRDENACYIHATVEGGDGKISVGIERTLQGKGQYKLNGTLLPSVTALTQHLPMCLLHPERLRQLSSGPKAKRQLLDWGLFYHRKDFLPLWQQYQQARQQRNAALKQRLAPDAMAVWSRMLCDIAPQIDTMRAAYLDQLGVVLEPLCERLLQQPLALSWQYVRGWPQDMALAEVFEQQLGRDMAFGYTQYGPHRADFVLKSHGQLVQQVLSQGQQKLLAYALLLAQMQLLCQTLPGILLIDDLPAELDQRGIAEISRTVLEMQAQTFVTSIAAESVPDLLHGSDCQVFHVKHGTVGSSNVSRETCETG